MEEMTIERAVEILRQKNHRGRCDWEMDSADCIVSVPRHAQAFIIEGPDALIVASWYEGQAKSACPSYHEHDGDRIIYFGDPG